MDHDVGWYLGALLAEINRSADITLRLSVDFLVNLHVHVVIPDLRKRVHVSIVRHSGSTRVGWTIVVRSLSQCGAFGT